MLLVTLLSREWNVALLSGRDCPHLGQKMLCQKNYSVMNRMKPLNSVSWVFVWSIVRKKEAKSDGKSSFYNQKTIRMIDLCTDSLIGEKSPIGYWEVSKVSLSQIIEIASI